jgi:Flp pilus assembly protein TadG
MLAAMKSTTKVPHALAGRVAVRFGLARLARRFTKDQSGATAVEFGIVAVPFFALLFAILETAMAFFAAETLETAVSNASRLIRTGQAQQQGLTAATFKDAVCGQLDYLFSCSSGLYIDVKTFPTFGAVDLTTPRDVAGNFKKTGLGYVPGKGSDIVVVRGYYEWPVFVNKLGNNLSDQPNGTHLLVAVAAFRNEPFPW